MIILQTKILNNLLTPVSDPPRARGKYNKIIRIKDLELFFYDFGHGQCNSIPIQKELRRLG
jgi:hypothetical protein